MAAKTLKEFDRLTRRDFDNGALLDEIRSVYKQRDALLEACELVEPAITSLLDELGQRKATDWRLVNDCLCSVAKAIAKAKQ